MKTAEDLAGIIVCARVKSSRILEKVLAEIAGKRSIEILLQRCIATELPVVLAIPENPADDILHDIGKAMGVKVYRGQDDSPLHRMAAANKAVGKFENVIRVTADDILIDSWLMEKQLEYHMRTDSDYTYLKACPEGCAGEIIKADVLERIAEEVRIPTEYTSYYLKAEGMKVEEYVPPREYRYRYRLTMDYPEDLTVLRILLSRLHRKFGALDIVNFMENPENWWVKRANKIPMVSVYTCTHNQPQYLKACMDSVMNQANVDMEYIIVDDCSEPETCRVILDWYSGLDSDRRKRVSIHRNDMNIGLPASCNVALGEAKGRWVLRVDSDDALHTSALARMLEASKRDRNAAAVYAGYWLTDEKLKPTREVSSNVAHHPGCSLLLRSAAHEVKYRAGVKDYEGTEFRSRFDGLFSHTHIDEPLWFYRRHPLSKSAIRGDGE